MYRLLFLWLTTIVVATAPVLCDSSEEDNEVDQCNLSNEIKNEIKGYTPIVKQVIESVLYGEFKGTTYKHLEKFVDKFGNRMSGTDNLENAIDYMLNLSAKKGLDNVHGEKFNITHWVRGKESLKMIKPRKQDLPLLGLGSSVGTPTSGIQAKIVVVSSFEELDFLSNKVKDKIVVFNQEFVSYGETVVYRSHGADRASKYGAVAALVRSITPFSMRTPHTGWQDYSGKYPEIPVACITVEDAMMLHRRYKNGEKVVLNLQMEAETLPDEISRNVVLEIKGREDPDKAIIVSGHLDSWDVGEGAMDDGAGAMLSWNSIVILNSLRLKPRRTLRAVLWSGEEVGLVGAEAYAKRHEKENIQFVFESDEGTFSPEGLTYAGPEEGGCILKEILRLFHDIDTTKLEVDKTAGSDIEILISKGIPGASLLNKNNRYFWFHHTEADTLAVENSDDLDKCTAFWAAVSYIVADLSFDMPKKLII